MKDRLARALHRIACRLSPLPPLVLLAEGWHYADRIRQHLAETGIHLTVGLMSPVRSPPLSDAPAAATLGAAPTTPAKMTGVTKGSNRAERKAPQSAGKNRKRKA